MQKPRGDIPAVSSGFSAISRSHRMRKTEKLPLLSAVGVFRLGFGKKRGRKEVLRRRKEAAHGFRNLSVYKISFFFELQMTHLKTKFDEFMNEPFRLPR